MAWSWSHTDTAYNAARENLHDLPLTDLHVIYAEWRASQFGTKHFDPVCPGHDSRRYWDALRHAVDLPGDVLADIIWDWSSEYATCDNGGWNAWVCPHGCHTVPFDRDCLVDSEPGE